MGGRTTGRSVRMHIPVRRPAAEIRGRFITPEHRAPISGKVAVRGGTLASLLMEFLNAGFIQLGNFLNV